MQRKAFEPFDVDLMDQSPGHRYVKAIAIPHFIRENEPSFALEAPCTTIRRSTMPDSSN